MDKHRKKIFDRHDEAVKYAKALKRRGKYIIMYTSIEWDD